jgi:hypothetical protein
MCQYNDKQLPHNGSRANSRNLVYNEYTSNNQQCPTEHQCNLDVIFNAKNHQTDDRDYIFTNNLLLNNHVF